MGLRRMWEFIIFFKKQKMQFPFWGPMYQKNKTKKKKTNMFSICDSLFWGRKRVKRRNEKTKIANLFCNNNVKCQESVSY